MQAWANTIFGGVCSCREIPFQDYLGGMADGHASHHKHGGGLPQVPYSGPLNGLFAVPRISWMMSLTQRTMLTSLTNVVDGLHRGLRKATPSDSTDRMRVVVMPTCHSYAFRLRNL